MSFANRLPAWKNVLLAVLSAVLLILAFPDFEFWFLAWFALVPLMWAVEREKESTLRSFILGWIFGTAFFFGTCWWLTYAPITYAAFPPLLAYTLFFFVAAAAGLFPGLFAAVLSNLIRRFGPIAILAAPFVWVFTEFLRYWVTGNNWNAIGYSQAFDELFLPYGTVGGVIMVSWACALPAAALTYAVLERKKQNLLISFSPLIVWIALTAVVGVLSFTKAVAGGPEGKIIALQPNVPMSGLTQEKWRELRQRHVRLAESAINSIDQNPQSAIRSSQLTVIFPESPMNFQYEDDPETRKFINEFAAKNSVSVLFNSAEPNPADGKYFNSAVLVGPQGREVGQYDKIYLLPFGESVPAPLQSIVPAFVGSFSYGSEYDLLPLGDAQAGVMICFESHFGELSREYVRNGADVIIEMTNDGYLGPTPVLRQHLANAVFRAVETNRPVLRVTNVGITAYINARGEVLDAAPVYQEDTRIWSVAKSDGSQTLYVKYGDWFAWLCTVVTIGLLTLSFARRHGRVTVEN